MFLFHYNGILRQPTRFKESIVGVNICILGCLVNATALFYQVDRRLFACTSTRKITLRKTSQFSGNIRFNRLSSIIRSRLPWPLRGRKSA